MVKSNRIQIFELIGRINGGNTMALIALMDKALVGGQDQLILI